MTDLVEFEMYLFSPRWGIYNTYEVYLSQLRLQIGQKAERGVAICTWNEGSLPVWSNTCAELLDRNPLEAILEKDLIHPPTNFVRALQVAWRSWRIGILSDDQVKYEIKVLCEWVNIVSAGRPRTDFWKRVF